MTVFNLCVWITNTSSLNVNMTEDDTFKALKKIPMKEMMKIIGKNNREWEKLNTLDRIDEEFKSFHRDWRESNIRKLKENGWTEEEYINYV